MNKKQLGALLSVNLRLVNPQVTDRYRKKGKSGSTLTKKLTLQFFTSTLAFMVIYGLTMLPVDFSKRPGMFTFYVGLFVILGISQSISGLYNVFFAGKDLASYLPLPFRQLEIFLSKILIVSFNVMPFSLPLLVVFYLTAWHSGIMIPVAVLLAIVVYALVMILVLMLCALIVFGLTKTKVFRNHQNLMINGLMALTTLIALGGILLMSKTGEASSAGPQVDRSPIAIFMLLFDVFNKPVSMTSGLTWLAMLALMVIFGFIIKRYILPQLSSQLTTLNSDNSSSHRKVVKRQGINANLDAYNLQLLKEPNLLLQVVMNSIMVPVIFMISFAFAKVPTNLTLKWLGVFFVAGMAFSGFTTNQASLVANLISLDRENFEFVRSMPISMKLYLQRKFRLGYLMQLALNVLMIIIISFILKVKISMAIALILGTILGTYLICLHYFSRDYRLRLSNWTNVTELFNRGGGNLGMIFSMMATIFLGTIIVVGYSVALIFIPQATLINSIATVLVILVSFLALRHYRSSFWSKFD